MAGTLADLLVKVGVDTSKFDSGVGRVGKGLRGMQTDINKVDPSRIAGVGTAAAGSVTGIGRAQAAVAGLSSTLTAIGWAGAIAGAVSVAHAVVSMSAEFEASMQNVAAVSGATGAQFKELEATALQLGSTTKFSASQAAEGMSFLAMAGLNTTQIIAAMPGVLDLAAAGALDLGTAADVASNIMSGFALSAGEMNRVSDVLAQTAASANTNVSQMGQAMKFAAPAARAVGVDIEGAAAAVGVLSNSGIQATMAGTNLRGILIGLSAPSKEAEKALAAMGLSLSDVDVQARGLPAVLQSLQDKNIGLADAARIFGRENASAVLTLTKSLPEYDKLVQKLEASEGAAGRMAEVMNKGLKGAIVEAQSSIEGLAIELGKGSGLLGALEDATDGFSDFVRSLTKVAKEINSVEGTLGRLTTAYGKYLTAIGLADPRTRALTQAVTQLSEKKIELQGSVEEAGRQMASEALVASGLGDALGLTAVKSNEAADSFQRVGERASEAKEKVEDLEDRFDTYIGLDWETADNGWLVPKKIAEVTPPATKAVDDLGGAYLDLNTALKPVVINFEKLDPIIANGKKSLEDYEKAAAKSNLVTIDLSATLAGLATTGIGALINGESSLQALKNSLKDLALNVINDLLIGALDDLLGKFGKLKTSIGGIFGGGGSGGGVGSALGGGGGGGGAGAVAGGGGALGVFNAVTGGISAVADIFSAVGIARLEGTMNAVELNTRQSKILLEQQMQDIGFFQNDVLQDIRGQLNFVNDSLDTIKGILFNGVPLIAGNTAATASNVQAVATEVGESVATAMRGSANITRQGVTNATPERGTPNRSRSNDAEPIVYSEDTPRIPGRSRVADPVDVIADQVQSLIDEITARNPLAVEAARNGNPLAQLATGGLISPIEQGLDQVGGLTSEVRDEVAGLRGDFAATAGAFGSRTVNVYVEGSVVTERDLVESIAAQLDAGVALA